MTSEFTSILDSGTATVEARSSTVANPYTAWSKRDDATATIRDQKSAVSKLHDSVQLAAKATISNGSRLDAGLIQKALEAVDEVDADDRVLSDVRLYSLAGIVGELWQTAALSSQYHRQTLAAAELALNCLINNGEVTPGKIRGLRAAIVDLAQPVLTAAHVQSTNSYLLDEGLSPMAILQGLESEHDGDRI